jgi:hypothetical protein
MKIRYEPTEGDNYNGFEVDRIFHCETGPQEIQFIETYVDWYLGGLSIYGRDYHAS